ncbi:hypothetical protein LINPERHAP2_LOCUS32592, partial [Linum perenne]
QNHSQEQIQVHNLFVLQFRLLRVQQINRLIKPDLIQNFPSFPLQFLPSLPQLHTLSIYKSLKLCQNLHKISRPKRKFFSSFVSVRPLQAVTMEDCKRRWRIPPFGDWESTSELPITQYFASARQTGLAGEKFRRHVYSAHQNRPNSFQCRRKPAALREKAPPQSRKQQHQHQHQGRVRDVEDPLPPRKPQGQRHQKHSACNGVVPARRPGRGKAVDEDLYKIPDELLPCSRMVWI